MLTATGDLAEANPIRYAGYYYDEETKNYYLQARYYNPANGAFLALDPHPGDEEDPLSQNGYSYANGNPVMKVDPNGEYSKAFQAVFSAVGVMVMMMIRSGAKQQAIINKINKKLNKYIKNVKKYRVIWGGKDKIITIIDKKSKKKDKRIFAIEKGVAPYKNKKTGKQKQLSGYWHYHLPNGGHYQPWYMAPSDYKIIK